MNGNPYEPQNSEPLRTTFRTTRLPPYFPVSIVVAISGFVAMVVSCGLHGVAFRLPREQWSAAYIPLTVLLLVQSSCALWARATEARADVGPNDRIAPDEHLFRVIHLTSVLPVLLLTTDAVATFVEFGTSLPISGQTIGLIKGSAFGIIGLMWVTAFPVCVFVMLKHRGWRVPLQRLILHCSVSLTLAYPLIYVVVMWSR